jgi:hypothetical protein
MSLRTAALVLAVFTSTFLAAQPQAPAPPPQTAREALIEMFTSGEKGLMKHLTLEVQELLSKPDSQRNPVYLMFKGMQQQVGNGLQSYPTGSTLFLINEPAQHKKFEVHVENDDLSADEDALQLSLHSFQDGQEQQDEFGYMSSRITIAMKKQQNVWRLSNVGVGMEFPVGDPAFLKKMFYSPTDAKTTGVGVVGPGVHTDLTPEKPAAFDPAGTVALLGFAERSFARQHPDVGFTCSFSDLNEASKNFGLDPQIASGTYMGYKWNISGCEGKPAGSFQIVAEPIVQGRGAKAACVDATENVRTMDDGRGSACLAFGKVDSSAEDDSGGMIGFKAGVQVDTEKSNSEKPKP